MGSGNDELKAKAESIGWTDYSNGETSRFYIVFDLRGLEEHVVLEQYILPLIGSPPDNVRAIIDYAFTEILNNAIDHSEGTVARVLLEFISDNVIVISVGDDGVGIFRKIQRDLHLENMRDAIIELCKGKLTTDPSRHTGEGIFFTSRACNKFIIVSGGLILGCDEDADWLIENQKPSEGTIVALQINRDSTKKLDDIFGQFTAETDEGFGFTKTHLQISLAEYGPDGLTSRSKAKRVLNRISKFKEVILDFKDVQSIGQAFADEIFRVFAKAHPEIHIDYVRANENVTKMIRRVTSNNIED